MIKKIWDNLTSYGVGKNSATPIGRLLINNTAAEVGILPQMIDMASVQNVGDVGSVELEILTGGAAPAANQNLTIWAAFCSSGSKTPTELLTAASSQVCVLPQVMPTRRRYMMPLFYMGAQYLYVWFDHSILTANATLELNLIINAKRG